jgi:hypothetical protein
MKIRSLITALAIAGGSSSAALADTSVSFNANASWGYGPSSQPVIVRDHRAPVADDDCDNTSPVVQTRWTGYGYRPVLQTEPPIWNPGNKLLHDRFGNATTTQYDGPVFSLSGRRSYGLVPLTQPTRVENSITDREDFLILGQTGMVRALQLRGMRGSTFVKRVTIEFMNEEAQIITPNQMVTAGGAINISVKNPGRGIKRIFVYGESGPGAMYQFFGA